ncbi:hypothetical protein BD779DRAFT_1790143, partial [Infundibulicybe gibba]
MTISLAMSLRQIVRLFGWILNCLSARIRATVVFPLRLLWCRLSTSYSQRSGRQFRKPQNIPPDCQGPKYEGDRARDRTPPTISTSDWSVANASIPPISTQGLGQLHTQAELTATPLSPITGRRIYPNVGLYRCTPLALHENANRTTLDQLPEISEIPACTTHFISQSPPDWQLFIHPNGMRYFWNPGKSVLTEADLFDNRKLTHINAAIAKLERRIRGNSAGEPQFNIPSKRHLVLDLGREVDGKVQCGYYYAAPDLQCLFWLETFPHQDVQHFLLKTPGVRNMSHIRYMFESHYWEHFRLFPHVQNIPEGVIVNAKNMLLYDNFSGTTDSLSTAVFEPEESRVLINLLNEVQSSIQPNQSSPHAVSIIGWIMSIFALHKFKNFHGQVNARYSRDQSVYQVIKPNQTALFFFLSLILFRSPETHLQSLDTLVLDGWIFLAAWKRFVRELHLEWRDLTIIATVLLATNVGFLAIPGVGTNTPGPREHWPSSLVTYPYYPAIKGWETVNDKVSPIAHGLVITTII